MMMAASSIWAGWDPIWEPSLRVIRMVPVCIQSGPVGTMVIPAGSHCSWKAVVKSALTVSYPPSTYMVQAVGVGWVSSTSVVSVGGCAAGHPLAIWGGSVLVVERIWQSVVGRMCLENKCARR